MGLVTSVLVISSLVDIAASHPPGRRHPQIKFRGLQTGMARRDSITVVVSAIPSPTTMSEVVVFVYHNGQPVRTATELIVLVPSTITRAQPQTTQATSRLLTSAGVLVSTSQQSTSAVGQVPTHLPDPSTGPSTAGGLNSQPSGAEGGGSTTAGLPGVAYSPFDAYGTCKAWSHVFSDFQKIATQYGLVRIYGVDCGQVAMAVSAAKSTGLKLFLGIFNLDNLEKQTSELVDAVSAYGDWSVVETVSVGNELVDKGQATVQQVIDAVAATRRSLRSAGFYGSVVTVDTVLAVLRNPWLCDYSDFCAVNIHPFFDPSTPATAAGDYVRNQMAAVRKVLRNPTQRIVVTETGWPWQGCANGAAVPGKQNQRAAIASIKTVFGAGHFGNLVLFSAFNDMWKKAEPSTFYAEQYWGINQF